MEHGRGPTTPAVGGSLDRSSDLSMQYCAIWHPEPEPLMYKIGFHREVPVMIRTKLFEDQLRRGSLDAEALDRMCQRRLVGAAARGSDRRQASTTRSKICSIDLFLRLIHSLFPSRSSRPSR
jgi:hypothetical protein